MLTLADELLYVVCPNPNPNQHGEQQDNIIPAFELPNLSVMSEENGYQMTMIWQPVQGVIGIMEWWTLAIALLFLQCHHEVHLNHEISLNYWMDFHFSGGYICLFWSPEMFSTVVPVCGWDSHVLVLDGLLIVFFAGINGSQRMICDDFVMI